MDVFQTIVLFIQVLMLLYVIIIRNEVRTILTKTIRGIDCEDEDEDIDDYEFDSFDDIKLNENEEAKAEIKVTKEIPEDTSTFWERPVDAQIEVAVYGDGLCETKMITFNELSKIQIYLSNLIANEPEKVTVSINGPVLCGLSTSKHQSLKYKDAIELLSILGMTGEDIYGI